MSEMRAKAFLKERMGGDGQTTHMFARCQVTYSMGRALHGERCELFSAAAIVGKKQKKHVTRRRGGGRGGNDGAGRRGVFSVQLKYRKDFAAKFFN